MKVPITSKLVQLVLDEKTSRSMIQNMELENEASMWSASSNEDIKLESGA